MKIYPQKITFDTQRISVPGLTFGRLSQFLLSVYMLALVSFAFFTEYTNIEDLIGSVLALFIFFGILSSKKLKFPWHWSLNILFIFIIHSAFTLLYNPLAIRRFITLLLVLGLFYVVFFIIKKTNNIYWLLTGLAIGILYLFFSNLETMILLLQGITKERFGGGYNPNMFTFVLLMTVMFLLKPVFQNKAIKKYNMILGILLLIICTYLLLYATGSRKGILFCLIIFAWTFFVVFKSTNLLHKILLCFLVAGILLYILSLIRDLPFYYRLENLFLFITGETVSEGSIKLRFNMLLRGIELWTQKPLLGWGFGSYRYVSGLGGYSHSNYIEILANQGIIGFLLYYSFYVSIILSALKKYKSATPSNKGALSWALMILVFLILYGAVAVSYYSKVNWILTGVALATIVNVSSNKSSCVASRN